MPSEAVLETISTTPVAPTATDSSDQHPAAPVAPGAVISEWTHGLVFRQVKADVEPDVHALYHELLYAVASKFPGETRHETALRYIRERETHCGGPHQDKNA